MFSMAAVPLFTGFEELARLGVLQGTSSLMPSPSVLGLGWDELERALPDRGLPRGVVEVAARAWSSPAASFQSGAFQNSGATSIALAAIRSMQSSDECAWCAWMVSPEVPSLYAPAFVQAGVDLDRLLVVRPSRPALARTAVKVAASGAFGLVVIDAQHAHDLAYAKASKSQQSAPKYDAKYDGGAVVVRKLALAAEESGTTSLLLTSAASLASRPIPWPVALRLEVERRPESLAVRVTKDRRGLASSQHVVRLAS
jgi:hypothetical protein